MCKRCVRVCKRCVCERCVCILNLCGRMCKCGRVCRCGSLCGGHIVQKVDVCKEYCKSVLGRGDGGLGLEVVVLKWVVLCLMVLCGVVLYESGFEVDGIGFNGFE